MLSSISLKNVIPNPLRDKLTQRPSQIWNTEVRLPQGEWIKIKAPSGSGKTTLVHTLYKLRSDFKGEVWYDDRSLQQLPVEQIALIRQQYISIVFQDLRLLPQLTALENIQLKNILGNVMYNESDILKMAERLQITHILQQQANTLSYGEQQRVAIVRALVQPFAWLIMDEPFSHLDINNTKLAAALIAEECTKRKAGFILTDLDDDNHFPYTKQLTL
ncbi:MAG TPA: ATP-binding cassette domain-containing protein [Chitinophagaceae bacterium]|nr:ATP-binding cassette domain-containing protein [Chitinophagaceae bacterium]